MHTHTEFLNFKQDFAPGIYRSCLHIATDVTTRHELDSLTKGFFFFSLSLIFALAFIFCALSLSFSHCCSLIFFFNLFSESFL